MRVLLGMNTFGGYFRQFEPALRELLARGHSVHLARPYEGADAILNDEWAEALREDVGDTRLTWSTHPPTEEKDWGELRRQLRLGGDYLGSRLAPIDDSSALARRVHHHTPDWMLEAVARIPQPLQRPAAMGAAVAVLDRLERAIPPSHALVKWLRRLDPDVVALTPHLMPGSTQTDVIRAGQALGMPTALCIASWDNLSSKQRIRVRPDLVTVWNETQSEEARTLHGLPAEIIETTGAQVYDDWFTWQPRPRRAFCRRAGLEADRPYVLYAAGALLKGAPITEAEFAKRWVQALRSSSHATLRDVAVLVRPHPKRVSEWRESGIEGLEGVAMWPPETRMPVADEAKADFFDSLHHSAVVVGINTSAMIEAGIIGRRVLVPLVAEFADSQERTLHFRYLTDVGGGLLQLSHTIDQHVDQLAAALAAGADDQGASRGFLEAFIRPHGLEQPAAPVLADAIERVAGRGRGAHRRPTRTDRVLMRALEPVRVRAERSGRRHRRRRRRRLRERAERAQRAARERRA